MTTSAFVKNAQRPISVKIFGIAVGLLGLMIVVTFYSSLNLRRMNQQLDLLSTYYIELDQLMSDTRAQTLREVIQIERVMHTRAKPMPEAEAKAQEYFKETKECETDAIRGITAKIRKDFPEQGAQQLILYRLTRLCTNIRLARAAQLVEKALLSTQVKTKPEQVARFIAIKTDLANIQPSREKLLQNFDKFLNQQGKANEHILAAVQEQIDERRVEVNRGISSIARSLHAGTKEAAELTESMENRTQWLSWSVTIAACILGLVAAYFITRNMVRPVRELVSLTHAIRSGDLGINIQIKTGDEIGLLADSFNHMVGEMRQKEQIKSVFGKYLDPRIVQTLLEQNQFTQSGHRQSMSVFFSDLEGFTSLCETLMPDMAVRLLNQYFSLVAAPIRAQNGIIDKYIGDSVMAYWGPPFSPPGEHAKQACLSALGQLACMPKLHAMLPDILGIRKNIPTINVRMGIATGDMTVGSIGSDDVRSYTVIGDNVNLASRLEGANKLYHTHILISEETHKLAGESIEAREIDAIRVVGKTDPVRIYELLGKAGDISTEMSLLRTHYERGLQHYRARQWDAAEEAFNANLKLNAEDGPSKLFALRVKTLRPQSLPENWDGVWTMTGK